MFGMDDELAELTEDELQELLELPRDTRPVWADDEYEFTPS